MKLASASQALLRVRPWPSLAFDLEVRWRALLRALERRHLRNNEVALIALAAVVGVIVGFGVVLVHQLLQRLHEVAYALPPGHLLSEGAEARDWRLVLVPALGGLLVGLATWVVRSWRHRETVDPIEANALYGGRMSIVDSINLMLLTLISAGLGASVGLEAAYTQLGAGIASKLGQLMRARRGDLRMLVGCGAAAAIAAAFNAPLAGAFYAFELVIGSYAAAALAPVSVAALAGVFTARWTLGSETWFQIDGALQVTRWDYAAFALLGFAAGGLGILTMLLVTRVERLFRLSAVPIWLRPMLGGLALGAIAFYLPQVLGSGHGAIQLVIGGNLPLAALLLLLPAKTLASAVSVGAGFRGGLFSSSLFLGSLLGAAPGALLPLVAPDLHLDALAYTLVGMGAVAAAVVGAPVTMILLVLELTADFYVAMGVMVAVIVAATTVRLGFGYSFSTWRFHLRGLPVRGAADIGWLRDLTVGKIMRREFHAVPEHTPLAELRRQFPLGGPKRVFLCDAEGNYAGIVQVAEAHSSDLDERLAELTAAALRQVPTQYLLPGQMLRAALDRFVNAEAETLAVVRSAADRKIIGLVTEAYALRRYNQALEQSRAEDLRESGLFGPA